MKLSIKYKIGLFGFLAILSTESCKKYIQVDPPINQITTKALFNDKETAVAAINGLYSRMMDDNLFFLNGGISIYGGLSSDELLLTAPDIDADPFLANSIPVNSSIIQSNFWRKAYSNIYQANLCIEGLSASSKLDQSLRKTLTGEMLVARSLCYFYLANFFGDVPLITTTNYQVNAVMPRTKTDDIYGRIIEDLKEAKSLLPNTYPTIDRARPNKWTAVALLSRVYLYNKKWSDAEREAGEIINSGVYSLVTSLSNVFSKGSNEIIWQLAPVLDLVNSAEGFAYIPAAAASRKPKYVLSNTLLNSFEAGDLRKSSWVASKTVSGQTFLYPFKYRVRTGTPKTEYNVLFRLAEQYLIRAEARVQQNKLSEGLADLNIIRLRAGLPAISTITQATLVSAIENERRIEFFAEWGHRWLDLKRTNKADIVLGSAKATWQPFAALYPIPQAEILLNRNLLQNPGY